MTISSTTRIAGPFTGNGVTTTFPFTYKVFSTVDVQVIRLNISTGLETTLIIVTDYTITLNGDQDSNPGGNIVLVAALSALYKLTATSDIANLQPTDLTNQGGFFPEVITDALDRATIQIQQISDIGDRTLKIPISDGALNMELPTAASRANSFLAFGATGLPTVVTAGSSGAPTTMTRQNFSGTGSQVAFTLASDPGALGNSAEVFIGGVYQNRTTYTIGGTTLTFSTAPVAGTDNIEFVNFLTDAIGSTSADLVTYTPAGTGAVARSAQDKFRDIISVKDFGAVGDGVADDTAAFNTAITAAGTKNIYVPGSSYAITGTVTGSFYSDGVVTIVGGTVNTVSRIGSVLSTTGNLAVNTNKFTVAASSGDTLAAGTFTATGGVVAASLTSKIQPITASVAASALTITLNPTILDFRSSTLPSGTVTSIVVSAAISLTIPSTSTMGTTSAVQSRIVVLAINNAGTVELAAVNIAGGSPLDETTLITTTAAVAAGNSATAYYSTAVATSVAYRVVGYIESTQATAGTWASAPTTIQGMGGQALTAMSSLGYGQTLQSFIVATNRISGTTYYNTTGKPITIYINVSIVAGSYSWVVDGVIVSTNNAAAGSYQITQIIQVGGTYAMTFVTVSTTRWYELR